MSNREIQALHRIYKKHDPRVVGHALWAGRQDPVYACSCGKYYYISETTNGPVRYEYNHDTVDEWLVATAQGLKGAALEGFRRHMLTRRGVKLSDRDWLTVYGTPRPSPRRRKAAAKRKGNRARVGSSAQNGTRI